IACASAALAVVLVRGTASRAADDTQAVNVTHEPRQPKLPAPPPAPAPKPDRPAQQPRPRVGTAQRPLLSDDDYTQLAGELRDAYSKPREQWPAATTDPAVKDFQELGPLPEMPFPADNPHSKSKVDLGKQLFFNP